MVKKKKALGIDPLGWIKSTKDIEEQKTQRKHRENTEKTKEVENIPKFETYEVKLTLRLNDEQLNFLTNLERSIMKNRSSKNKKERITKNSLIRSSIELLKTINFDKSEISEERVLIERILKNSNK